MSPLIEARNVVKLFGQTPALRRNRFGFGFQFGPLVPELTAEENVALPLLYGGTRRGPAPAEAVRRIRDSGTRLGHLTLRG